MPSTSPSHVLSLKGHGDRWRVDALLCLALCNRNLTLCQECQRKAAGMEEDVEGKQLIAMVTSIFAKFFTSICFHFQPFSSHGKKIPGCFWLQQLVWWGRGCVWEVGDACALPPSPRDEA